MSSERDRIVAVGEYLAISGVAHLLWEILQLPLYTIGQTGTVGARAFAVVHCTGGDIVIATWTLVAALALTRRGTWPRDGRMIVALTTIALGLLFTAYSEWQNVYIKQAWAYTPVMPTVRVGAIAIGIAPLAQWMVIPVFSFGLIYRWMRT